MESLSAALTSKVLFRESQINTLLEFFGHKDEPFPESVFLYGTESTGKSFVVEEVLKKLNLNFVVINLIECYSEKILFESILNKISGHVLSKDNDFKPFCKCDNSMDFILELKRQEYNDDVYPLVLVLDKAEKLRNHDILASVLCRLQEFTSLNISVIFISNVACENYSFTSLKPPTIVYFPQYSKDELLNLLLLSYNKCKKLIEYDFDNSFELQYDFYKNYLNILLSVFYRSCHNLTDLNYLARHHLKMYCLPVFNNEINQNNVSKLWRHMAPIFRQSMHSLHSRVELFDSVVQQKDSETIVNTFQMALNFDEVNQQSVTTLKKPEQAENENLSQTLELPFYAKYLLIASYLASYNPAKEDKRLFMKYHGKKRKTVQSAVNKCKTFDKMNLQIGPKPFTLDRLLAIFYAIIDEQVGLTSNLLVQLSSLVELKLLIPIGNDLELNGRKYKCIVDFNCIQNIAKMVGFNIKKYLYDLI